MFKNSSKNIIYHYIIDKYNILLIIKIQFIKQLINNVP